MSERTPLKILLLISLVGNLFLALLAGLLIFSGLGELNSKSDQSAVREIATAKSVEESADSSDLAKAERLKDQSESDKMDREGKFPPDIKVYLARLEEKNLRVVPEAFFENVHFNFFDYDGRLTDVVADILGFGPERVERLNKIFEKSAETLRERELKVLEFDEFEEGKVLIKIPALESEFVENVRRSFFTSLRNEVGEKDFDFVLDILYRDQNIGYWDNFGETPVEIIVNQTKTAEGFTAVELRKRNSSHSSESLGRYNYLNDVYMDAVKKNPELLRD